MGFKDAFLYAYDTHYKKFMLFSMILLVICAGFLLWHRAATGEFVAKGVSLKGGLTVTIPISSPVNIHDLGGSLSTALPKADLGVRELTEGGRPTALIVEAADTTEDELIAALKNAGITLEKGRYSVESMGSALGSSFYQQTFKAIIVAFLLMAVVVFVTFRSFVPSAFVILTAASDIVSTLAVVSFLGIKLSTAGVAAFLMLIGYSVDTDILLTSKVLKRKAEGGTIFQRTMEAFKTGVAMTLTGFAAAVIGYVFSQSDVIKQIMLIIAVGMIFDLVYTWCQNAGILRWYLEKKEHAAQTHLH